MNESALTALRIPERYHPRKKVATSQKSPLLAVGSQAPNWTLMDSDGKKLSLTQLKGKLVVIDFFFIGCYPCMLALSPSNKLHEQFKNKKVVILSMSERDKASSVNAFKKQYRIPYPIYIGAKDVVQNYHVTGFPTFYFIDKSGKIVEATNDYTELTNNAPSMIDRLLVN